MNFVARPETLNILMFSKANVNREDFGHKTFKNIEYIVASNT